MHRRVTFIGRGGATRASPGLRPSLAPDPGRELGRWPDERALASAGCLGTPAASPRRCAFAHASRAGLHSAGRQRLQKILPSTIAPRLARPFTIPDLHRSHSTGLPCHSKTRSVVSAAAAGRRFFGMAPILGRPAVSGSDVIRACSRSISVAEAGAADDADLAAALSSLTVGGDSFAWSPSSSQSSSLSLRLTCLCLCFAACLSSLSQFYEHAPVCDSLSLHDGAVYGL